LYSVMVKMQTIKVKKSSIIYQCTIWNIITGVPDKDLNICTKHHSEHAWCKVFPIRTAPIIHTYGMTMTDFKSPAITNYYVHIFSAQWWYILNRKASGYTNNWNCDMNVNIKNGNNEFWNISRMNIIGHMAIWCL
jgi:hypothetical protein